MTEYRPARLLVFGVALSMLAACLRPVDQQSATDVVEAPMDTLVSASWLREHIDDSDLVVIDATVLVEADDYGNMKSVNGRASYEAGHIPTAVFADLMGELSDAGSPLEFAVPSPGQFAAAMGALGVGDDSRVVIYDANNSAWAARVWWMLRWIGFDRAALLDGGLEAWKAAGGALSTEPSSRPLRTLSVRLRPELIADQEEVRAAIDDDAVTLVDSLPEPHYRGEWAMYDRPGHITSAINVPVTSLFDESGRFRPREDLEALFEADRNTRNITYCGGGIAAAADAFVMTRLGFTDVAIYAASLQEWAADPDNPMEVAWDAE